MLSYCWLGLVLVKLEELHQHAADAGQSEVRRCGFCAGMRSGLTEEVLVCSVCECVATRGRGRCHHAAFCLLQVCEADRATRGGDPTTPLALTNLLALWCRTRCVCSHVEGHLYELDGSKSIPINHGPTTQETLLKVLDDALLQLGERQIQ